MAVKPEVSSFIRSTFRSVWALEMLCFLRKNRGQPWSHGDLVAALRGSELLVSQSVGSLTAAGLVVEADGTVRYQPVSEAVDKLATAAEALYATRPDAVRRMIVAAPPSGLTRFADAFKLWPD
ncbi:hypothetical protein RZN05_09120 [Sphingomonas sp. HF-S4]|uniref:Uncharacterized protein n=1 Tax=Sphingomonas agrestis TaxID=3080540 RepID=A0ABU3Y6W4_9SPHN|nr:hypothetical protein [Sphingomonas sp. HF-S4]MDV3457141.1 hypothetical protein [Sphingomonas sp. HF-S4]